MVVRVREVLAGDTFALAAQAGLAPQMEAPAAAPWELPWVVAEPAGFALGTWKPGLRELALDLYNAGRAATELHSVTVEADWIAAPGLPAPVPLGACGEPLPIRFPLRPEALVPGKLSGTIRLAGPGWERVIPADLFVPLEPQAWWGDTSALLATHVERHTVRLTCAHTGPEVTGQLQFLGRPVEVTGEPALVGGQWEWTADLFAGEYSCDLIARGKAQTIVVDPPHRWDWAGPGKGRLHVGPGTCQVTVRNIGADPVDLRAELDVAWAEVQPARLQLQPGAEAVLQVVDRLTDLQQGEATATLRLVTAGEQQLWAVLPVGRRISGEMALPVVVEPELTIRSAGARTGSAQLRVRNAGGHPLRMQVITPPELRLTPACTEPVEIPPGHELVWGVTPTSPSVTGTLHLQVHTETAYPTLREIAVPVHVEQIALHNDPPEIEVGTVLYLRSAQRRLRLSRSDGSRRISAVVTIPEAARDWLSMESGYLTVRNLQQNIGPVETVVTVEDQVSGAVLSLPVRASLQRPAIGPINPLKLTARPGQVVERHILLADQGRGLVLEHLLTSARWIKATHGEKRFQLKIKVPNEAAVDDQWVRLFTNDPVQPQVTVPIRIRIRMSLMDRLRLRFKGREKRLRLALWGLAGLLLLVGISIGLAAFYYLTPAPQGGEPAWPGTYSGTTESAQ
jgi:hypothetical protein